MKSYSRKYIYTKEGNKLPIKDRTFKTNEGYDLEVVDGGSKNLYITCRIEEYVFETVVCNIKNGSVKYPLHHSVYKRGYLGIGKYKATKNRKHTKVYKLWNNMLERAYDEKYHAKRPTYKDVEVCKEWLNFQNFADWFYNVSNYKEGWQLDKDLLSGSKKVYSPQTCIFVPSALNTFLANKYISNTSGVIGVCWKKQNKKWNVQINDIVSGKLKHLGYFTDIEDATIAYKKERKEQSQIWRDRMKGLLPDEVIVRVD